jgi:hypothetical protein
MFIFISLIVQIYNNVVQLAIFCTEYLFTY